MAGREYPGGLSASDVALVAQQKVSCPECGAPIGSACTAKLDFGTVCRRRFALGAAQVKHEVDLKQGELAAAEEAIAVLTRKLAARDGKLAELRAGLRQLMRDIGDLLEDTEDD